MKHLHILRRVNLKNSKELFMCADPECTWSRRKEFLLGKKFTCPFCGNPYLVDQDMLRRKFPHCKDCTAQKEVILQDPLMSKITENLVQIMPMSEVGKEIE